MAFPRIAVFLAGCVTAAGVGYYRLHQDVYKTSRIVEDGIKRTHELLKHQNVELDKRVYELQKENEEFKQQIEEMRDKLEMHQHVFKSFEEELVHLKSKLNKEEQGDE